MSASSGVKFDLFATGNTVNTGWVSGSDGLLVLDRNHDGLINSGSELFGSATTLANGQKATDGYAALKEFDANSDSQISKDDAVFADLGVWVDANSNGLTEAGEVKTLASLGITSISTEALVSTTKDNGNLIGLTSTYETADGASHAAADVWFVADKNQATSSVASADTTIVETLNGDALNAQVLPDSDTNVQIKGVIDAGQVDLRSRVSGIAQAIGVFGGSGQSAGDVPSLALIAGSASATASTAASLAVVSMADVMRKFDSNGNPVSSLIDGSAPAKSLQVSDIKDPSSQSLLFASSGNKVV